MSRVIKSPNEMYKHPEPEEYITTIYDIKRNSVDKFKKFLLLTSPRKSVASKVGKLRSG